MLNPLTVVEEMLGDGEAVFRLQVTVGRRDRWLLRPSLRVLNLRKCFLSCGLIYELLLLLRILGGIGHLADLDFGLVVVHSLDYLVVPLLPRILGR